MSEETKIKSSTSVEDYERSKKYFNDDEYSQEEFLAFSKLYSDHLEMLRKEN